jgi:phage FluMu protein Com
MSRSDTSFEALRCKHCDAIVAELPRAAIVHRFKLRCPHCAYENIIRPPDRDLDNHIVITYTGCVPV